MNTSLVWKDQVPPREGLKSSINDLAVSPNGSRLVCAVGNRVLLYDLHSGDLLESLRAHKETVTCVDFSYDGSRFASGSSDTLVIIWKISGQGLLKYTHIAGIQRVVYSPNSFHLLSCSDEDFGMWSPQQKQVSKEKIHSKILCAAWAPTGSIIALGLENGCTSVRKLTGEEIVKINRRAPVFCLLFLPSFNLTGGSEFSSVSTTDVELIVGCWDKTLCSYRLQGNDCRIQHEKALQFYPCSISIAGSTSLTKMVYLVISGSNGKTSLYSKECSRLADLNQYNGWICSNACHSETERVVTGSNDGNITVLQMTFDVVHAISKDRYVFRENLTEVVIQHLLVDRKVRIKCKDMVEKVSLYKNKLVVQLSNKINIYESNSDDPTDMHFRIRREKIPYRIACELMITAYDGVLFCNKTLLEFFSFDGHRRRVWELESKATYMKMDGGFEGSEYALVGLDSGVVLKLFVDNPFPVQILAFEKSIICCDISPLRSAIASIDTNFHLTVTHLASHKVLLSREGANFVIFHNDEDEMLSYTCDGTIYVVAGIKSCNINRGEDEGNVHRTGGIGVCYSGQRLFTLINGIISGIDLPLEDTFVKSTDKPDYELAYRFACLGATESDWKMLAKRSLRSKRLNIAHKCFSKLRDDKYLSLLEIIQVNGPASFSENGKDQEGPGKRPRNQLVTTEGTVSNVDSESVALWRAEVLAYEGHFGEAAKIYARMGNVEQAIRLLVDLRRWDDARMFSQNAGRSDLNDLIMGQANWQDEIGEWSSASELYLSLGRYMQAAGVIVKKGGDGWTVKLIELVRITPKENKDVLEFCSQEFSAAGEESLARETLRKLGNMSLLMALYVKRGMWLDAAKLFDEYEGDFDCSIFLSYAEWLLSQDKYEDAMHAFRKADRVDLANEVLMDLTSSAVGQAQYKDAAYYFWLLSKEAAKNGDTVEQSNSEFKADLYYAYSYIHSFTCDPFTNQQPEVLFQVARFIINSSCRSFDSTPLGVSKGYTFYALAKQSMKLESFKLARHCYEMIGRLQIPRRKYEEIELEMLMVQAKAPRDNPDTLPVCYRCGATNPLLNPGSNKLAEGDVCTTCGHPFVRSFINFEILPLVEFMPESAIGDDEAIDLIRQSSSSTSGKSQDSSSGIGRYDASESGEYKIEGKFGSLISGEDSFNECINKTLEMQQDTRAYMPVSVDISALLSINRSEVFICKPSTEGKRATFYRNMLPDIAIAISRPCHRFFHLDEFEFAILSNGGKCIYSQAAVSEYGSL